MELISGKMTSKGQVTIPKELREKFNVKEGDQFKFFIDEEIVRIEPVKKKKLSEVAGQLKVNGYVEIDKIRETAHKEAAKEIYLNKIGNRND